MLAVQFWDLAGSIQEDPEALATLAAESCGHKRHLITTEALEDGGNARNKRNNKSRTEQNRTGPERSAEEQQNHNSKTKACKFGLGARQNSYAPTETIRPSIVNQQSQDRPCTRCGEKKDKQKGKLCRQWTQ
eukprot:1151484-Pelagomonas_calceolata.AAC.2